ncbi:MAG: cytochrome P460 family protein [Acidobacteriota bacterium]
MSKRTSLVAALLLIVASGVFFSTQAASPSSPRFSRDGKLEFPADYREWIFLSAGKGMTYGPAANPNGPPLFDNVFVQPGAYHEFLKTGKWPDKSMFALEVRTAATEGSINHGGQFQKDLAAVEVEVKDTQRFAATGGWAYFNFAKAQEAVAPLPNNADCHTCHSQNAAVEHTFVQFYPTLIDIAKRNGTFKDSVNGAAR